MMHSVRRVPALLLVSALVVACSPDDTDPAALEVCGGTVALRSGFRLLATTRDDGVTLHYFGPEKDVPEPRTVASLFTSTDVSIRFIESVERVGPETSYLGSVESDRDRACNGIVSLNVGEAAQQVLLDVDGSSSMPWVAAINIGRVP